MPENLDFKNIFAGMTPVRCSGATKTREASSKPLFKVTVAGGTPYLELAQKDPDRGSMTAADAKLYDELRRAADSRDAFGIDSEASSTLRASFYENPYLIYLVEKSESVLSPSKRRLMFADEPASLTLDITTSESKAMAAVRLCLDGVDDTKGEMLFLTDTHLLAGDTVYEVKSVGQNYTGVSSLVAPVEKSLIEPFLTLFMTFVDNVGLRLNGVEARAGRSVEHAVAMLYLEKVAADKALYVRTGVSVESLDNQLPAGIVPTKAVRLDAPDRLTVRRVEGCDIEERTDRLETMILSSAPDRQARREVYRNGSFFIIPESVAGPFLLNCLPQVLEEFRLAGSEKLKEYKVVATRPKLNLKFSSGIDYLEGDGDVTIGDESFSVGDILNQFARKRYIQLSDGNRVILDSDYINRLQRIFRRRDKEGRIRVTMFDLPEVEELLQQKIKGPFANRTRAVLEGFNTLRRAGVPECHVDANLRPYQAEGIKWLKYLYDNKLGGCLADDMGLGKTLQTIALLSMIYPGAERPSLIVMPRSLLFNWEKELDRFCPALTHSTYYGTDRNLDEALKNDIVLTTYALVRNDIAKLREHRFELVVLDESQNIKTCSSQTTAAVQLLESDHRLALSGTPMENNLTELYSLFRFLNPTMFGSLDDFNASYTGPIQKYGDKDASESLRRKIFPFIMRRMKKDVLDDLPERIDQTIYVEMTDRQRALYNSRRLSYRRQIGETIAREGVAKSQFLMFQALNELRRIASVPESVSDGAVHSPKIDELVESLVASVSNGHKSVVFFNFIAGVEIVMSRLEKLGIGFETMTGSTSAAARKRIVERFQSSADCKVMLLTLKVGGVGLNLTAADTVYIFEPWWNKAAEEQAINRLHRIGQKSAVSAFSIITVGTIEEKILQLQAQKSELFNELISSDAASSKHLTEKDIEFILS